MTFQKWNIGRLQIHYKYLIPLIMMVRQRLYDLKKILKCGGVGRPTKINWKYNYNNTRKDDLTFTLLSTI